MGAYKYTPTKLMLPTSRYDKRRADFAVGFIQMLKHTTGEWYGKPFHLMPWQEQIIRDIFGIVDADGYRQFRTAYVEVGKKNGKSELAAAIALYLLFADGEAGAGSGRRHLRSLTFGETTLGGGEGIWFPRPFYLRLRRDTPCY